MKELFFQLFLIGLTDEEIFVGSTVHFHNQPAGIIVAQSSDLANTAAELVDISYKPSCKFN
jgi:xanthine dehydrogenase molybdopterin-binding subunit B